MFLLWPGYGAAPGYCRSKQVPLQGVPTRVGLFFLTCLFLMFPIILNINVIGIMTVLVYHLYNVRRWLQDSN